MGFRDYNGRFKRECMLHEQFDKNYRFMNTVQIVYNENMGALEKVVFFLIVRYSFITSIADEDGPYLHISIGYLESLCIYKIRVKSLCVFFFRW